MCQTGNFWWIVSSWKADRMLSDGCGCVPDAEDGFWGSLTVCHAQLHSEALQAGRLSGKSALPLSSGQCWRKHQTCLTWSNGCLPDWMLCPAVARSWDFQRTSSFLVFSLIYWSYFCIILHGRNNPQAMCFGADYMHCISLSSHRY